MLYQYSAPACRYQLAPDGNWYRFHSTPRSFDAARAACRTEVDAARLMTIKTRETKDFLDAVFKSGDTLWLGATDRREEGIFRWVGADGDGGPSLDHFPISNWFDGEPNDAEGGGEDCAAAG